MAADCLVVLGVVSFGIVIAKNTCCDDDNGSACPVTKNRLDDKKITCFY